MDKFGWMISLAALMFLCVAVGVGLAIDDCPRNGTVTGGSSLPADDNVHVYVGGENVLTVYPGAFQDVTFYNHGWVRVVVIRGDGPWH